MQQSQKQEVFVPIFMSQQEYEEIMKQPPHLQQQMMQQIYLKNQNKQPEYQQLHPYLALQQQQQQDLNNQQQAQVDIPPIPQQPDYNPYLRLQQQQYTPQQQLYQQYQQNLNQPLIQQQIQILEHKEITNAGKPEIQYFNKGFVYLFTLQNLVALFFNFISVLFGFQIITYDFNWSVGLSIVLALFVIFNLFIITNSKLTLEGQNQKHLYFTQTILYAILMQGLQTFISGDYNFYRWDPNFFFYYFLQIVLGFVTVYIIVKQKRIDQKLSSFAPTIIIPQIMWSIIVVFLFCRYRYYYFFIWVVVVILITFGELLLIKRINKIGYNNFKTNDCFGMAVHFPMLLLNPFYDN